MLFKYKAINATGSQTEGVIDSIDLDTATRDLQKRGFVVSQIVPAEGSNFALKFQSLFIESKAKT